MMLSLQNSINSRNGPGGNKNRSVWLRVGVTGVAFQGKNSRDRMNHQNPKQPQARNRKKMMRKSPRKW